MSIIINGILGIIGAILYVVTWQVSVPWTILILGFILAIRLGEAIGRAFGRGTR